MAADRPVIRNEDDAWNALKAILDGDDTAPVDGRPLTLKGWPKLKMHIPKPRISSSITPSLMEELVEVQRAVLRAYAIARYENPDTKHLTRHEREFLEFSVAVRGGSSNYEIDVQAIVNRIIDNVSDKMDPYHITVIALAFMLLYFGKSAFSNYLDHRLEKRREEIKSDDALQQLEGMKFLSNQETERMKIMANALSANPRVPAIMEEAEDVHAALVRGAAKSNGATVQGIKLDGAVASELMTNARRSAEESRIDGEFNIQRVDTTHPDGFMVRLEKSDTGETLTAGVQDALLSEDHRKTIREAEWKKKPITAKINVRKVGGNITKAVIVDVENKADE